MKKDSETDKKIIISYDFFIYDGMIYNKNFCDLCL